MSKEEPKIKRIFSLKGCSPCATVKEIFADEIAKGEIVVEEIGDISDKVEMDKAMALMEAGIVAFPTFEIEGGKLCRVSKISDTQLELECQED